MSDQFTLSPSPYTLPYKLLYKLISTTKRTLGIVHTILISKLIIEADHIIVNELQADELLLLAGSAQTEG